MWWVPLCFSFEIWWLWNFFHKMKKKPAWSWVYNLGGGDENKTWKDECKSFWQTLNPKPKLSCQILFETVNWGRTRMWWSIQKLCLQPPTTNLKTSSCKIMSYTFLLPIVYIQASISTNVYGCSPRWLWGCTFRELAARSSCSWILIECCTHLSAILSVNSIQSQSTPICY
jgi:hypothetical protein